MKGKNHTRVLSLLENENDSDNNNNPTMIYYNLNFLNGLENKLKKIQHLTKCMKNLVPGIDFEFYSMNNNNLYIFFRSGNNEKDKDYYMQLLDSLMNETVDFYVKYKYNLLD
jgi:hypothetical protein